MQAGKTRPAVVLLVEDDPGDQELTRRAFNDGVYRVDLRIASGGEEAMSYLTRTGAYAAPGVAPEPDMVLLDLNMPGIDGREVLRRVRSDPKLKHLVVVVLTTSDQDVDILRSYSLSCNSYITKPVGMDQFVTLIRQLGSYWFELVTLPAAG